MEFSKKLSPQENMLLAKYKKLKKLENSVLASEMLKPKPKKPSLSKPKAKLSPHENKQRAIDMIKSGSIKPIKRHHNDIPETFKRPIITVKRVIPDGEKIENSYDKFSSPPCGVLPEDLFETDYNCDYEENKLTLSPKNDSPSCNPKIGCTILVSAYKISEEIVRKYFSVFGAIENITMDLDRGHGYVTYSNAKSANMAVTKMHSKFVEGGILHVKVKNKEPHINKMQNVSSVPDLSFFEPCKSDFGEDEHREMLKFDPLFY